MLYLKLHFSIVTICICFFIKRLIFKLYKRNFFFLWNQALLNRFFIFVGVKTIIETIIET